MTAVIVLWLYCFVTFGMLHLWPFSILVLWANIGKPSHVPQQVPMITKVQKSVDVPQIEYEDKIVEVPIQKPVHLALLSKDP